MSNVNLSDTIIVKGEKLKNILNIPKKLLDKNFEITLKQKGKKNFPSFKKIKLDTRKFKFDRQKTNAR